MQREIAGTVNLTVIEDGVDDLIVVRRPRGRCSCAPLVRAVTAKAVVLTTGTFLRGLIHRGEERIPAGRVGEASLFMNSPGGWMASGAAALGRLKTGNTGTAGWADDCLGSVWKCRRQMPNPVPFSFLTEKSDCVAQIACGITWTNAATHKVIADNLHEVCRLFGRD